MLITQPSTPNKVENHVNQGMDIVDEGDVMKMSSWNHAGTWEEKDMTEFSKSRITSLCLDAEVQDVFPMNVGKRVRAYVAGEVATTHLSRKMHILLLFLFRTNFNFKVPKAWKGKPKLSWQGERNDISTILMLCWT